MLINVKKRVGIKKGWMVKTINQDLVSPSFKKQVVSDDGGHRPGTHPSPLVSVKAPALPLVFYDGLTYVLVMFDFNTLPFFQLRHLV